MFGKREKGCTAQHSIREVALLLERRGTHSTPHSSRQVPTAVDAGCETTGVVPQEMNYFNVEAHRQQYHLGRNAPEGF